MSFASFDLHATLNGNITSLGYRHPTPIQSEAIPHITSGCDVMGLAQTGTGKTAAFALPILNRLMESRGRTPRALIIAPTRELAEQINDDFRDLGRGSGLAGVTLYGGVPIRPQIDRLRQGVDVVVACPGRLLDHIKRRTVDLRNLEILVLDEADQMFDMGFLPTIREIVSHLPKQRQSMLFSATMPAAIRDMISEFLTEPVTVEMGEREPATTVSHALYPVQRHLKTKLLCELLERTETDSVLIFTRTKHRAQRLGEQLQKAGFKATCIQGNLSQSRRRAAMNSFRQGRHDVLVATDIAARGIDVSTISHVINFDIPDTVTAYTHRVGRTGRATRQGDALTLAAREDRKMVNAIERTLDTTMERRTLDGFDYEHPAPSRKKSGGGSGRKPGNGQSRNSSGATRGKSGPQAGQRHGADSSSDSKAGNSRPNRGGNKRTSSSSAAAGGPEKRSTRRSWPGGNNTKQRRGSRGPSRTASMN